MSTGAKEKKIFDTALLLRVFRFAAPYKKKFYISIFLAIILERYIARGLLVGAVKG